MGRFGIVAVALVAAAVSSVALAFEEQKLPPTSQQGSGGGASSGITSVPLSDSGVSIPRLDSGTKIRVPGLGVIGEIPKMDFGLELLYGAQQPKGIEADRTDANGVMGRVTVPIKPSR